MMSLPLISVIVPVYNTEKYISRCIDSILVQTYKNFELILVDDGCTDGSGTICDAYAKSDVRVRVIHKKNGGVTAARADGVKISKGEWITFVDADDTLTDDALNILCNNICDNYDIINGSYNDNVIWPKQGCEILLDELNPQDYRRKLIAHEITVCPWGNLIRKTLFSNEVFNIPRSIIFGEDLIMNLRLSFSNAKNIKLAKAPVYNYLPNDGSCVHSFNLKFHYFVEWYKHIQQSFPPSEIHKYAYELIYFRLRHMRLLRKHYIRNNIWRMIPFHEILLNDIKKHRDKIKLSKLGMFALSFSNPITNMIFLVLCKICRCKINMVYCGDSKKE